LSFLHRLPFVGKYFKRVVGVAPKEQPKCVSTGRCCCPPQEATAPHRGLLLPHVSLMNLAEFQLIAISSNDQRNKATGMVVWNTGEAAKKIIR
jgi:hypothetical protein